jgi:glycosyltransferase involved in cell wall biosynthesis
MLVKNEEATIGKTLESVKRFLGDSLVHAVFSIDPGTADRSEAIIRTTLPDCTCIREAWDASGGGGLRSRLVAEARARSQADYLLMLDADDPVHFTKDLPDLRSDGYHVWIRAGSVRYTNLLLLRSSLPWKYVGVIHEYPCIEGGSPVCDTLPGDEIWLERGQGSSHKNPAKYHTHMGILANELRRDPANTRTLHYYAQSCRDAGYLTEALLAYRKRAEAGGWAEERYTAIFEIAKLQERLEAAADVVIGAYMLAHQARPSRAEPLVHLAEYAARRQMYALAAHCAEWACDIPHPAGDVLYVENDIYEYRAKALHAEILLASGMFPMRAEVLLRQLSTNASVPKDRAAWVRYQIDLLGARHA